MQILFDVHPLVLEDAAHHGATYTAIGQYGVTGVTTLYAIAFCPRVVQSSLRLSVKPVGTKLHRITLKNLKNMRQ
ncbi:MAG: hypothetical protein Q7R66_09185 [Undibacterium sp.]|nr:hypothetical protein [Undibacterium sp.]MDO8652349.1 hypothetical protein [Undibacterium sp.]